MSKPKQATVTKLPTARKPRKKPTKRRGKEVRQTTFERALTYTMAGFVPMLSLTLARFAGVLHSEGFLGLALFAATITVVVLSVSLPHLAHAIELITASPRRVSWALAVAFDLGVILSELCHTVGPESLKVVAFMLLVALTAMSAVLNGVAFTRR